MYKTRISLPLRFDKKIYGKSIEYVEIGATEFYRPSKIMWIKGKSQDLPNYSHDNYIEFPARNVNVYVASENHLVITKGDKNLFYLVVDAPYKGSSQIIYEQPSSMFCPRDKVILFEEYKSRKGRLGVSAGALILTDKERIRVEWIRKKENGQTERGNILIDINGDIIEEEIIMLE
ncbi:MAG: hypothetical protein JHC31_12635 [Sulfurihydrogenibium sp.]|jgi:hypothetical protein|nr:hypothetical protein [Sulfurihydrogenibium sp.]